MNRLPVVLLLLFVTVTAIVADPPRPDPYAKNEGCWKALYVKGTWWVARHAEVWVKSEVVQVDGLKARLRSWVKFGEGDTFAGEGSEQSSDFVKYDPPKHKDQITGSEQLRVGLEDFDCETLEYTQAGQKTKVWRAKRFGHYLPLRIDSDGKTISEVLEFHENKDAIWRVQWEALVKPGQWWIMERHISDPFIAKINVVSAEENSVRLRTRRKLKADDAFTGEGAIASIDNLPMDPLAKPQPQAKMTSSGRETLRVGSVDFDCTCVEWEMRGVKTKFWYSDRFGCYLPIRVTSNGDLFIQLLEFHDTPDPDSLTDPRAAWRKLYVPGAWWVSTNERGDVTHWKVASVRGNQASLKYRIKWSGSEGTDEKWWDFEEKYLEPVAERDPPASQGEEKLKIGAVEFDCVWTERKTPLGLWKVWISKEYGQVLRREVGGKTEMRVIEFHDGVTVAARKTQWQALYQAGSWWIIRYGTTWTKTEILAGDGGKLLRRTSFKAEADKDFVAMSPGSEVSFDLADDFEAAIAENPEWKELSRTEEKIAGVDCWKVDGMAKDVKCTVCPSKKFGYHLLCRCVIDGETTLELTEFHEGKASAAAEDDPLWLYRKKGNFWTYRSCGAKADEAVSYNKTEITDVTADEVTIRFTMMDKDLKVTFEKKDEKSSLKPRKVTEPSGMVDDEVECKALGKVKARRLDTAVADVKTSTWVWRGLVVKKTTKSKDFEATTELWETNLK